MAAMKLRIWTIRLTKQWSLPMLNSAALKLLFDQLFYMDSDAEHMARLKDSVLGHRPTSRAHRDCGKVAHMACFSSHEVVKTGVR